MRIRMMLCALALVAVEAVWGAVGCDLNDPDRDVRKMFPESTGFKTEYVSVAKAGGEEMYRKLETELGDKFGGIYETIDVPYTAYTILKDGQIVGYIHGVNQKGKYGGMQVFIAFEPDGRIRKLTFQKLTSRAGKAFRSETFTDQFKGLVRADFAGYDPSRKTIAPESKIASIKPPAEGQEEDFHNCLRGIKKNFVLTHALIIKK